jgi:anaerobic selenocysteine-containing dehydrogenase
MAEPRPELVLIGRRHLRNNNSWMGNVHRLAKGPDRCTLMINPADAARRGIVAGATVRLASAAGEVVVPCEITDAVMPGVVSLPHGYGHARTGVRLGIAGQRSGASHNDLTRTDRVDPLSGNAALTGTPVELFALPLAAE